MKFTIFKRSSALHKVQRYITTFSMDRKLFSVSKGLILCFSFLTSSIYAQLSGTKIIPGQYGTLQEALLDIDAKGIAASGLTLELKNNYSETAPLNGFKIKTGGSATGRLKITSAGRAKLIGPELSESGNLTNSILEITGADFVTIEKIDLVENELNNTLTSASNNLNEFGIYLTNKDLVNSPQNIRVQFVNIQLKSNYINSVGIYSNLLHASNSVSTPQTVSTTASILENITIENCTIQSVNQGITLIGAGNISLISSSFTVTNTTISNFGFGQNSLNAIGLHSDISGIALKNCFQQTILGNNIETNGDNATGNIKAILLLNPSVSFNGNYASQINKNSFSLIQGANQNVSGIEIEPNAIAQNSILTVKENSFKQLKHKNVASQNIIAILNSSRAKTQLYEQNTFENLSFNTSGNVRFIQNTTSQNNGGLKSILFNKVHNCMKSQGGSFSFYVDNGQSTDGTQIDIKNNQFTQINTVGFVDVDWIRILDQATVNFVGPSKNIQNNTFESFTLGLGNVRLISLSSGKTNSVEKNNFNTLQIEGTLNANVNLIEFNGGKDEFKYTENIFSNCSISQKINSFNLLNINQSAIKHIIHSNNFSSIQINASSGTLIRQNNSTANGLSQFKKNTVSDIQSMLPFTLFQTNNGDSILFVENKIENISYTGSSDIHALTGISISGLCKDLFFYSNRISNFKAENATGNGAIRLVQLNLTAPNSKSRIYHNTLFLAGNQGQTDFGSTLVEVKAAMTTNTNEVELKNNLFVNVQPSKGNATSTIYGSDADANLNFLTTSSNNVYAVGANGVIGYFGNSNFSSLLDWQQLKSGFEFNSFDESGLDFNQAALIFESLDVNSSNYLKPIETLVSQIDNNGIVIDATLTNKDPRGKIRAGYTGYLGTNTLPAIGAMEFPDGQVSFELTGNGVQITPNETATNVNNGTDFGALSICKSIDTTYFILKANGTTGLIFSSIEINPSVGFKLIRTIDTLLVGKTDSIGIAFDPTQAGTEMSTVKLISNDNANPTFTFNVSGQGIADTELPVPLNSSLPDLNIECGTSVEIPKAIDNCADEISATCSEPIPFNFNGTKSVTWSYDDGNGNITTQNQTITINDTKPPVLPALDTLISECSITISIPTALDACSGAVSATTSSPLNYTTPGYYTIQWSFDDGNGNRIDTLQIAYVYDSIKPVFLSKPQSITLNSGSAFCGRNVTYDLPTFSDNCTAKLTQIDGTGYVSGNAFPLGTTKQLFKIEDLAGNFDTFSITITILDSIKPTFNNCPSSFVVSTSASTCDANAIWIAPTPIDNCGNVTLNASHISGSKFSLGTTEVIYVATDQSGNTEECRFTIEVKDMVAPLAPSLSTIRGACSVQVPVPATIDNCKGTITGTTTDPLQYTTQGTYTVTWKFTDGINETTVNQLIVVEDKVAPVAPTLPTITASCGYIYNTANPTATDNCSGTIVGTTASPLQFNGIGNYTIVWRFEDSNGNVSTTEQKIVIEDITPPASISLPDIITECAAIVSVPQTTDDCSGIIIGTTTDPLNYNDQGSYSINWEFVDDAGNKTVVVQKVIVKDNTFPTATAANDTTVNINSVGCLAKNIILNTPKFNDNCGVNSVTNDAPVEGFPIGVTTVKWTIKDFGGNETYVEQKVTVNEIAPTSITATACDEYIAPDGLKYTSSGIITATIPSKFGCDSIITIDLTINESYNVFEKITTCGKYIAGNGQVFKESGLYPIQFTKQNGCDSIINLELTILKVDNTVNPIDNGLGLEANLENVEYQWISCDENSAIKGETKRSYTPVKSGYYKVALSDGLCKDTTDCYLVTIGINASELLTPNGDGKNDFFEIDGIKDYPNSVLTIFNRWGKVVYQATGYQNDWDGKAAEGIKIGDEILPAGTYYYTVDMGDSQYPLKNQIINGYIYITR